MHPSPNGASDIEFYDDYYADGAQSRWREVGARSKADHIETMCREFAPARVLENGVGEGAVLAELSRRGFGQELYGVEISSSGIKAAASRNIPRVASLQSFDGRTLPFADKSMDLVYATHVLEHVEHERLFLQELKRVGRLIFLEVPMEDTLRVKGAIHNSIGHINFYNRYTFAGLIEGVGFEILRFESFDGSFAEHTFNGVNIKTVSKSVARTIAHHISKRIAEKVLVFNGALVARS